MCVCLAVRAEQAGRGQGAHSSARGWRLGGRDRGVEWEEGRVGETADYKDMEGSIVTVTRRGERGEEREIYIYMEDLEKRTSKYDLTEISRGKNEGW